MNKKTEIELGSKNALISSSLELKDKHLDER